MSLYFLVGALLFVVGLVQAIGVLRFQYRLAQSRTDIPAPVWTWNRAPTEVLQSLVDGGDSNAIGLTEARSGFFAVWILMLGWVVMGFLSIPISIMLNAYSG
jgi:hypothetical protein